MKNIAKYSVNKPISVLMGILIVVLLGVVSLTKLSLELFPEINLPYAVIVTTDQGANPYEVEADVTKPIEQNVLSISNVKNIQSTSNEHFSIVMVEFEQSTNMDSAFLEMRESFERLHLKEGVDNPMIIKFDPNMMPVMVVSLTRDWGDVTDEQELIKTTEWINTDVLSKLERVPGVASVNVSGAADTVIQMNFDDDKLAANNLTKDDVLRIIKDQNIEGLAGIVPDGENIRMLYIGNKIVGLEQLKQTPITYKNGVVTLNDLVKSVDFVNSAQNQYTKINGKQGITISFQKQSGVGITDAVKNIQKALDEITGSKEYKANYVELLNQGDYIQQSVGSVTNNLIIGSILSIVILFLFLRNIRPTLIVGLAIPISVIGAFALMYAFGVTLNIVSMGGLALGIGMLVDNSIVVIENIYRLLNEGKSPKEAAITGAGQVSAAITASTLTTISVFLPIVFVEGLTSELFTAMALTVTFSLVASLVIAITLVPTLSSKSLKQTVKEDDKIIRALKKAYEKSVNFALHRRLLSLLTILVILVVAGFLAYTKGFQLLPNSDEGSISVNIEMVKGTKFEQTASYTDEFVNQIMKIDDIDTVNAEVGSAGFTAMFGGMGSQDKSSITVLLKDSHKKTTAEISQDIEKISQKLDYTKMTNVTDQDVYKVTVDSQNTASMAGFGGNGIQVVIKGEDIYDMRDIADDLVTIISDVKGTKDVDNGIAQADDVVRIQVNKENAIKKGLTEADIKQAIEMFYQSLGFSMTQSEDTSLMIKVNGVDYEITVPQNNFQGINMTYDQFLSLVRVFDYNVSQAIQAKLDEQDSNFTLYYMNVPFIDAEGTIANPLYNKNMPTGALLINPMLHYNETTHEIYTPADMLTDTNPTLSSLAKASVYEQNSDDSIANVIKDAGFSSIVRDGKTRVITVSAKLSDGYKINQVASTVEKKVNDYINSDAYKAKYAEKGYSIQMAGENEDIKKTTNDMILAGVVAILLVYMVMAIQFQSLKFPFIVMFTIPLAFTGGFIALFIAGLPLSMVGMVGLIILAGIVVNNGIVLIDYINQLKESGLETHEAIIEAGKTRLRPILMTASTTILALIPLALGFGDGGELLQPLGVTAIGGLVYATILTLIIVPVMYSLLDRKKKE